MLGLGFGAGKQLTYLILIIYVNFKTWSSHQCLLRLLIIIIFIISKIVTAAILTCLLILLNMLYGYYHFSELYGILYNLSQLLMVNFISHSYIYGHLFHDCLQFICNYKDMRTFYFFFIFKLFTQSYIQSTLENFSTFILRCLKQYN